MDELHERLWAFRSATRFEMELHQLAEEAGQDARAELGKHLPLLIETFNATEGGEFLCRLKDVRIDPSGAVMTVALEALQRRRGGGELAPHDAWLLDLKPFARKIERFLTKHLRPEDPWRISVVLPDDYDPWSADPELSDR